MMFDEKELLKTVLDEIRMLREEMQAIKIVNIKQEINIKEHIKRSNLLEENVEMLRKELKPLQKHVMMVDWFFKLLGVIAVIISIIEFMAPKFH